MISKCECLHCKGGIEFEIDNFQEESRTEYVSFGQTIDCPHCGNPTSIYLPIEPVRKPSGPPHVPLVAPSFLLTIGDIGITSDRIVTPNGSGPLAGSQWVCTDMSRTESKMPAYAIILAIIFAAACFLGLLFLLMKEVTTTGYVEVTVQTDRVFHKVQIPVCNQAKVAQVRSQVNTAQALAARAACQNAGQ